MKTIVALWTTANCGKTETARAFGRQLTATYPAFVPIHPLPFNVPPTGDFRCVLDIYPGKRVAIESWGDPNTGLEKRLNDLIGQFAPDIILCASRTRGQTVNSIERVAQANGYQIIWTSPYEVPNPSYQSLANSLKGQHLVHLLQGLALI